MAIIDFNSYAENDIIKIQPYKYCDGETTLLSEVITREEPFSFSYTCDKIDTTGEKKEHWQGENALYAFPENIEQLVIGHTILDCLPCFNSDFSYTMKKENEKYTLHLTAKEKETHAFQKEKITLAQTVDIMNLFLSKTGRWYGTGCFHRAGLYHPITKEFIIVEDIGRHNCVDRLKGYTIMNNLNIEDYYLFITARITSSLYKKIRRAGITTIVSRSAITSTSYLSAQQDGVTLAAFCRPDEKRVTLFNNGMDNIEY